MKTKKEIEEWLKKQPWIEEFKANIKNWYRIKNPSTDTDMVVRSFMNGSFFGTTIQSAFIFTGTPEGYDYWQKIDNEFTKWYNN